MATTTIPWNDGSGDNIYVSAPSQTGSQTVSVTSDANTGSVDRTQTVTFTATANGQTVTKILTLIQEKVAEQYIVFADPVVEQICATKWGDGVGITPSQAAQVTNAQFGNTFQNNTDITSFDEFQYFTGITTIALDAFSDSSLERIVLPTSALSINGPFRRCTSLYYIEIPAGAAFPYANPFQNDTALSEITFHGATTFVNYCFNTCTNLKRVNIPNIATWFSFVHSQVQTIGQYSHDVHLYLIGSNTEITDVVIPNTITTIQQYACYYCTGITSVTIPSTVTSIGNSSFESCTSLVSVEIGASCASIGSKAFSSVGTTANKCTYTILATTPPSLANANAFTANRINKIYVPNGTLSAYQTASNWSSFASYMAELDANGNIPTT